MLIIRVACELGKFPDEVASRLDMDDLREFAGYLHLQNAKPEKTEEDEFFTTLRRPP